MLQATNALANEMTAALLTVQNGVRCFDDDQVLLCLLDMQLRAGLGEDDAGLRHLLHELVVRAGAVGLSRTAAEDKIRRYRNDHPVPLELAVRLTSIAREARGHPQMATRSAASLIGSPMSLLPAPAETGNGARGAPLALRLMHQSRPIPQESM